MEISQLSPQIFLYNAGHSIDGWTPPITSAQGIALPYLPSKAFGDGTHPTTRICAGAVDFICRLHQPRSVLDVGTGTGLLARIARARGAQFVAGTDIDADALLAARANAALDSHVLEIQILNVDPHKWGSKFNLIVANILEGPLCELAESLSLALAAEGILLISGFTRLQVPRLRIVFSNFGLKLLSDTYLDDWALLMFRNAT